MRMFFRMILWYHWNEYSNGLTKGILTITIIGSIIALIIKGYSGSWFFIITPYLLLLCNRGFGEPTWESKRKSLKGA